MWNSVTGTLIVELAIFLTGIWIYARTTRARDAIGRWSLAALILVLLALYCLNLLGGAPPSVTAVWAAGIIGAALLLVWSWWTDRHRESIST